MKNLHASDSGRVLVLTAVRGGASMDRFVARENINHFRDRLRSDADPTTRSTLQKLLVEEEDKLAKDAGLLADLAREIVKCQKWIEKQQALVEEFERDGRGAISK
jgi:hypothetical protein